MNTSNQAEEFTNEKFFELIGKRKGYAIAILLVMFCYVIPVVAGIQATNILIPIIFSISFIKPHAGFFYEFVSLLVIFGFTYHTLHDYFMSVSERLLKWYERKVYEKYKATACHDEQAKINTTRGHNEMDI
ncbi:hypothetical protein EJ576_21830 [Pseudomonas sp. C 49-2]|uniref:hypothetical protein n=1 Tax=Pseudomonas sp. C 49-2 TaxID=2496849 RepID=UPI000F84AB7C|nr:hypothetical protein [Pseudomonas sp. C 49-2]RTX96368.1 hypothetical protein EJ576_21830 [Pseudomonas sp. C 49-2]